MNRKNSLGAAAEPGRAAAPMVMHYAPVSMDDYYRAPERQYPTDAGYDLTCSRTVTIVSHGYAQIPTNIRVALPAGYWAMVVGRSSTFYKRNLLVKDCILDNGYRGELWVLVYNLSDSPRVVQRGDRISQLILMPIVTPAIIPVQPGALPEADRGDRGFGSTGGGV